MGITCDDVVIIRQSEREGEPSMITVNCPDKTGLGCDLCRIILFFGLSIVRGGNFELQSGSVSVWSSVVLFFLALLVLGSIDEVLLKSEVDKSAQKLYMFLLEDKREVEVTISSFSVS